MDRIIIDGLTLYGHCGLDEKERELGQKFLIDIEVGYDLSKAGRTDNLKDTIDYKEICKLATRIVKEKRYHLLEALAHDLAERITQHFKPREVMVRIRKPHPPIDGIVDWVGCEVRRYGN
jgi:dihydroneopterin aldolase